MRADIGQVSFWRLIGKMHFLTTAILTISVFSSICAIHVSVRNETVGKYCIILDADILGTVNYYDNKKNETVPYTFAVNGSAVTADGQCHIVQSNQSAEFITISFLPNDITPVVATERWSLKIVFQAPEGTDVPTFKIADYSLSAYFYPDIFNTSTAKYTYDKSDESNLEWNAKETHGFACTKSELSLTNGSSISFGNLKVLAFAILNTDSFPADQLFEQCKLDIRTSDLVPIVVGACLAGLVIIVLIAYIIGRARAKRQGYASV